MSNGTSYGGVINIMGQNAGDQFGYSVSGAGDVNNDGYPDVLVGAPFFENGQTDEGKAYLFGGTYYGVNTGAYWIDEGDQSNAHFGWKVAGDPILNDVNVDSVPDFAVSAPDHDNTSMSLINNGQVRFYVGSSSPTHNTTITGLFNNAQTGTGLTLMTAIYRTQGVATGTPTGVNAFDDGGTVQIWRWQ